MIKIIENYKKYRYFKMVCSECCTFTATLEDFRKDGPYSYSILCPVCKNHRYKYNSLTDFVNTSTFMVISEEEYEAY